MPPLLHTSRVAGDAPTQWMLCMHGILGAGGNWRSFSRKLVERRTDIGVVLVDLRMHGASQGLPPPHTLEAAAMDVVSVVAWLRQEGLKVCALLGHSFGGKVVMCLREMLDGIDQFWIIDASPTARPGLLGAVEAVQGVEAAQVGKASTGVPAIIRMLDELPDTFADRAAFVATVVSRGHTSQLAQWLAMNLEPRDGSYVFRLDLTAIRSMLTDYYASDLWSAIESGSGELHVIAAGKSSALDEDDRARLEMLESRRLVTVHEFREAGHWVQVEALDRLVTTIAEALPR